MLIIGVDRASHYFCDLQQEGPIDLISRASGGNTRAPKRGGTS